MNIQQMQYYREVCRWQNITRAAQELHIAQPTLSLAMQAIEQETGLNLFRHAGRNIRMTAEGEILYRQVERMLRQFARFESGINAGAPAQLSAAGTAGSAWHIDSAAAAR